ncbi:hypothetical protein JCM10908_003353 [Rhodotorula pacifica]|uniref:uncharacterized protein n=1 Tax=Rhodotorula pacifica TaxID=1495444 RepID=UPI00317B99AE
MSVAAVSQDLAFPYPAMSATLASHGTVLYPISDAGFSTTRSSLLRVPSVSGDVPLARSDYPLLHSLLDSQEYRQAVADNPDLARRPTPRHVVSRSSSTRTARPRPRKESQASDVWSKVSRSSGGGAASATGSIRGQRHHSAVFKPHEEVPYLGAVTLVTDAPLDSNARRFAPQSTTQTIIERWVPTCGAQLVVPRRATEPSVSSHLAPAESSVVAGVPPLVHAAPLRSHSRDFLLPNMPTTTSAQRTPSHLPPHQIPSGSGSQRTEAADPSHSARASLYASHSIVSPEQELPHHRLSGPPNRRAFSSALTRLKRALTRRNATPGTFTSGARSRSGSLGSFGASSSYSFVSRQTEAGREARSKRESWASWSLPRRRTTAKSSAGKFTAYSEPYVHVEVPSATQDAANIPTIAAAPFTSPVPNLVSAQAVVDGNTRYTSYGHRWVGGAVSPARATTLSLHSTAPPETVSDARIWTLWRSWLREKRSSGRNAR